jgi:hypothetical protein
MMGHPPPAMVPSTRLVLHSHMEKLLKAGGLYFRPQAEEFGNIRLRRSEKKLLNAINTAKGEAAILFCVLGPRNAKGQEKPKDRISTSEEKIVILVSPCLLYQAHVFLCCLVQSSNADYIHDASPLSLICTALPPPPSLDLKRIPSACMAG